MTRRKNDADIIFKLVGAAFLVLAGLITGIFMLFKNFFKKKEEVKYLPPDDLEGELKLTSISVKDTPIREREGEFTFLHEKGVQLAYLKSVSQGYLGTSMRVTRGVRFFYGAQAKTQKLVQEDVGDLFLTNQRIVFMGNFKTFETPLNKINAVQKYIDGYLGLSISGKSNNALFFLKEKIYLWSAAIEQIEGAMTEAEYKEKKE
ncbi:hypothetical protein A3A25_00940 [Candidatus Azambacteria bacterium RIFCSPLOWO2_01_FULL_46_26]|uniref:Uncharacterized protein n=2 Tax=Candidatus Azamiibacteriota TaxID=1752741 RepID=A0A1F5C5Y7_9BACT|nr:MAG: hypothetical protein A2W60_01400 [Candidatus Azambacteria bacterium RIFCSPHIGHO2_02_46_12]OGD38287.1 MAG: hypothetical protein A3A25_00940 [Candidatus Azambacteria bacterium RIFCSPLOWO2_01_FULL_46_26]